MHELFFSKDLTKDIEKLIGKNVFEMTENDFDKINRLTLNKRNFSKEEKDYNLKDLVKFKNLNVISLSGFKLIEEDIEILNSLKNLKFIHFDFCNFYLNKLKFNTNIEYLVFNVCKDVKLSMLEKTKAKSIKIIGSKLEMNSLNILDFYTAENLRELSLNNYIVNNIIEVLQIAPSLTNLNLDGSVINEKEELNSIRINISHEEEFNRANAW